MLQTIELFFTYMLPAFVLFYLAIDVFNRNRRKMEYRLVCLVILCFTMMLIGEYIRQLVPLKYSASIVNYWFANIGALSACFGIHFHLKITNLSKKLPRWLYLSMSYMFMVPGIISLLLRHNLYNSTLFFRDGIWNQPIFNVRYQIAMGVGLFIILLDCLMLLFAFVRAQDTITRKRLRALLWGAIVSVLVTIMLGYIKFLRLPPYPYLFGYCIWPFFLRWSMVKYGFLPAYSKRFHTLFDFIPAAILVSDKDGNVIETNPAAKRLLGDNSKQIFDLCSGEHHNQLEKDYTANFTTNTKFLDYKIEMQNWNGKIFSAILDADFVELDADKALLVLIRDITERQRYEEHLEYLAFHDSLTGLPDRKLFTKILQETMDSSERKRRFALLYLDGDDFKQINDTLGHNAGDEFLIMFADSLKFCIKDSDLLSRFGGDEFVILLQNTNNIVEATDKAIEIIDSLRKPFRVGGREFYVTCSIGICLSTDTEHDASTMLRYADMAMYEAKNAGRNTYRVYEPRILRGVLLESQLRSAFENGEFYLEFQPLVRFNSKLVYGFEALIRWNHPEFGVISPNDFISLAEKTGAIVQIGYWALKMACEQAMTRDFGDIRISVNVSARQIREPNFVCSVEQVLRETGLSAHRLMLEITESGLIEETQTAVECLHTLRRLGVGIAIDDFGTGFSSLSYLTQFPFDVMKIDRSFVQNLHVDQKKRSVIKALFMMCRALGIIVVIEGVETLEELDLLRAMGCDVAQGYLFSPPVKYQLVNQVMKQITEMPPWLIQQ